MTRSSSIPVGQRKLDEQRVHLVVGVQLGHLREQLVLAGRLGQPQVDGVHPGLGRRLVLEPDVDVGRRVVADEHRRQADAAERADVVGDAGADPLRERLAVHEGRCHPGSNLYVPAR